MRLKIVTKDNKTEILDITPAVECAYESEFHGGFYKLLRDHERQSDLYWIAHQCMKRKGLTQLEFGDTFLETLKEVDIVADAPNG
ncbi:MAG: hypothetical protein EB164_09960 [Thaumarchaeota archaeon]|jgi:hypothetical protein|nr:hypothetical protein [Nitrososphaerota archaeon]